MVRNLQLEEFVFPGPEAKRHREILVTGTMFGFPPCCLFHFLRAVKRGFRPPALVGHGPWDGTGFVPCLEHARLIRKYGFDVFVEREIVPRREPSLPKFPHAIEQDVWDFMTRMNRRILQATTEKKEGTANGTSFQGTTPRTAT